MVVSLGPTSYSWSDNGRASTLMPLMYGCAALSSIANSISLTEVTGLVSGEVANMIASIGHLFFLLLFNSSIFVVQAVVDTQLTGTWSTKSLNVSTGPVSRLSKRGFG